VYVCVCFVFHVCRVYHAVTPQTNTQGGLTSRVLIVTVSPDLPMQYIPIMNSVFCAQAREVVFDVCVVAESKDCLFLQQASYLTRGVYHRADFRCHAILQYLLQMFLVPLSARKHLNMPTLDRVEYKSACFCHQRVIDRGVTCPVCLALYCRMSKECRACGTRFNIVKRPVKHGYVSAIHTA
jgi:transcription initiation factor TFIIH subunit 3